MHGDYQRSVVFVNGRIVTILQAAAQAAGAYKYFSSKTDMYYEPFKGIKSTFFFYILKKK